MKKILFLFIVLIAGLTLIEASETLGKLLAWDEVNDTCYSLNTTMYATDCAKNVDQLIDGDYTSAVDKYYNIQETSSQKIMSFGEVISIISGVGILILINNKKTK